MGIMLVYDITNAKSFENISKWLRNIDEVSDTEPSQGSSELSFSSASDTGLSQGSPRLSAPFSCS